MFSCVLRIESNAVIKPFLQSTFLCKKNWSLLRELCSTLIFFQTLNRPKNSYSAWAPMHFLFHYQWPKTAFVSVTESDIYWRYAAHLYTENAWKSENLCVTYLKWKFIFCLFSKFQQLTTTQCFHIIPLLCSLVSQWCNFEFWENCLLDFFFSMLCGS